MSKEELLAYLNNWCTITWFVSSGLVDAEILGSSTYPLYDAAIATGNCAYIFMRNVVWYVL